MQGWWCRQWEGLCDEAQGCARTGLATLAFLLSLDTSDASDLRLVSFTLGAMVVLSGGWMLCGVRVGLG